MTTTSPAKFGRALKLLFDQIGRQVWSGITVPGLKRKKKVDLTPWLDPMLELSRPFLLRPYRKGVKEILDQVRKKPRKKAYMGADDIEVDPHVLAAVDELALDFCHETLDTLASDLEQALQEIRDILKEELEDGPSMGIIKQKFRKVFTDPYRADRIAVTETYRALNMGGLNGAKESGVVSAKVWLASSDACELCQELADKEVGLDEPFTIDPKAKRYAVVMHPPRHPHCMCSLTYSL